MKVSLEEGYRKWASTYDAYPNALVMLEEPLVRTLLGDSRGQRVLDAGCGTGRHALWTHAVGANVTGIDANPGMLEIARAKERSLAPGERSPFPRSTRGSR